MPSDPLPYDLHNDLHTVPITTTYMLVHGHGHTAAWFLILGAVAPLLQDSVTSVVVRGWEIIAGSVDGTVRRFDIRIGRMYTDAVHHPVTSVAVSHDTLCVLAACLDSTLRLLDKSSGELLASYRGHVHSSVKMDCCLTPSDAHVVGCSESGVCMRAQLHIHRPDAYLNRHEC